MGAFPPRVRDSILCQQQGRGHPSRRVGPGCEDAGMPAAEEVLEQLDPEQRAAAAVVNGPVCILAGAGTGKTRAITHRVAYAVLSGAVPPAHVLAVTFTARAAAEL